jgi:hypothetical protein
VLVVFIWFFFHHSSSGFSGQSFQNLWKIRKRSVKSRRGFQAGGNIDLYAHGQKFGGFFEACLLFGQAIFTHCALNFCCQPWNIKPQIAQRGSAETEGLTTD